MQQKLKKKIILPIPLILRSHESLSLESMSLQVVCIDFLMSLGLAQLEETCPTPPFFPLEDLSNIFPFFSLVFYWSFYEKLMLFNTFFLYEPVLPYLHFQKFQTLFPYS